MLYFIAGLFVGWLLTARVFRAAFERWLAQARTRQAAASAPPSGPVEDGATDAPAADAVHEAAAAGAGKATRELLQCASKANEAFQESAYPSDLLECDAFQRGVALMRGSEFALADLLNYYIGTRLVLACMAVQALAKRDDPLAEFELPLLTHLPTVGHWTRWFVLRTLAARNDARHDRPLLGHVLACVDADWDDRLAVQFLQEFVDRRVAAGELPTFGDAIGRLREKDTLRAVLAQLHGDAAAALRRELEAHVERAPDLAFLGEFGRRLGARPAGEDKDLLEHDALKADVERLAELLAEGRRSVLLVGEAGIGKSTLLAVLAQRLHGQGWTVFEAGAHDLLAGQSFIGQLEGRVQRLLKSVGGRPKVLWVVPAFHELMWAGRHHQNPVSLLEQIFPHLESGTVQMVAETQPAAFEQMLLQQPRLRTALHPLRVRPLDETESGELVAQWSRHHALADGRPALRPEAASEAVTLAATHFGARSSPGTLLRFLDATRKGLALEGGVPRPITAGDLLTSLSLLTGLPRAVLDHRETLDLAGLQRFFEQRVMGQPEALECLVDRVALIKAGLTDPGRPLGVFLFTGPTGTGKTELAKALAEYLFGSPERMIRLDMSELQGGSVIDRLLGDEGDGHASGTALVDAIRHQPFSVVLLDEFEKADARAHHLFLQLFDDGRLTDRRGRTADFRHAIVIMTSNLGADPSTGASVGFRRGVGGVGGGEGSLRDAAGERFDRVLQRTFAPEFINRIDRVVSFRPLGRAVMREILKKELADALRRRGLRGRNWAVEWEESAIDFLLRMGFTQDLGARPLRRAVERYLLSPLARTLVRHQVPEGEQFLFVRSDGVELQVAFVDPDASEPVDGDARAGTAIASPGDEVGTLGRAVTAATPPGLEAIVFQPRGSQVEYALLVERVRSLRERVGDAAWMGAKRQCLAAMEVPGFWTDPQRFAVLGRVEYMDRIETGAETADSLLQRLQRAAADGREQLPQALMGRLAQQLFLLEHACADLDQGRPSDTFVAVEALADGLDEAEASNAFAGRLVSMYEAWGKRRGMQLQLLEESVVTAARRVVLAVSGFGAYRILHPEDGLHVLEEPARADDRSMRRTRARVSVVPQPPEPAGSPAVARAQAAAALCRRDETPRVVRRYREQPSPLVRDSVRPFRTGRLDRVLEGEFDVVSG